MKLFPHRLPQRVVCAVLLSMAILPAMAQDDPRHPATKPQMNTKMTAQEKKNLAFVESYWREAIQAHHAENLKKYLDPGFIEHNPNMTGDAYTMMEKFITSEKPVAIPKTLDPDVVVKFAREDYVVFIMQHKDPDPGDPSKTYYWNNFHVLRLENGKIKEHWDADFKAPAPPAAR